MEMKIILETTIGKLSLVLMICVLQFTVQTLTDTTSITTLDCSSLYEAANDQ